MIENLIEDVYALFDPDKHHTPNEENIDEFLSNLRELLVTRLSQRVPPESPLRFSSLGKKDRQIWLASRRTDEEKMTPQTYFKFLYGDVIEQLLLFLVKEAGHTVERAQETVEVDGVEGHIDAIIDGVVVDVKSASPYGFKKFTTGELLEGVDPFGYVQQLSGYADVLTPNEKAAWLVMDKVSANLALVFLPREIIAKNKPAPRIQHLKAVIESDTPPDLCYQPEPDGKSGNMKLGTECSYCAYKQTCFPGLRKFLYSNGPRFLTRVVETPKVFEVMN